jgi:hypothetical protein
MRICQCHEIRLESTLICLFQARCGKGSRDENSGCRIRGRRRLVRVQRTAVVLGRAELVSAGRQLSISLAGAADGVVGGG